LTLAHSAASALNARRVIRWGAQAAIVVFLGWLVLRNVDPERLLEALRRADWWLLALAVIPLFVERIVRPLRLAILLPVPIRFVDAIAAQSVSQLVNLVLPLRSGELSLVVLLGAFAPISRSGAFSIVVIDRLLDIVCVLVIFAVSIFIVPDLPLAADQAAAVLAVFAGLAVLTMFVLIAFKSSVLRQFDRLLPRRDSPRADRWRRRVALLIDGFSVLRDFRRLLLSVIATVATWSLAVLGTWLMLRGFWPGAPIEAAALALCFGVIGVTLISLPAGIGVMHAAYVAAIVIFGAPQEVALAFAIVAHFLATGTTAIMGAIAMPIVGRAGISLPRRPSSSLGG
jgi:glycosyltransferase 2 family protein